MTSWNHYPANYGMGHHSQFYHDSTYGTGASSAELEDTAKSNSYFDRPVRAGCMVTLPLESYQEINSWAELSGPAHSEQASVQYSQPFDYVGISPLDPVNAASHCTLAESVIETQLPLSYPPTFLIKPEDTEEEVVKDGESEQTIDTPPKRKRGRPRLNRNEMDPGKSAAQRVPHNQVERKYRETLNNEMERLRLNIPTLPKVKGNALTGPHRPTKAAVLATAVQYIKDLEAENERLEEENEDLRNGRSPRPKDNVKKARRKPGS